MKARAGETLEQAVERSRQTHLDEVAATILDDARMLGREPDEIEMAMFADFRARQARTGDEFQAWFSQLVWDGWQAS